jgi:hypothetical protein
VLQDLPDVADNKVNETLKKIVAAKYGKGALKLEVASIEPEGGPTTGNTRVLVRGGPFTDMAADFPKPKCKFGRNDKEVDATYVACSPAPLGVDEKEARKGGKVTFFSFPGK